MPTISGALNPPTISEGFCDLTPQQQVDEIITGTTIDSQTTFDNIIISQTTPGINDRAKLWQKLNSDNSLERIYGYYTGVWAALNPAQPGDGKWMEFASEADVWSYDGGDGNNPSVVTPTRVTGAMWQVDHNYDGRSPMGVAIAQVPTYPTIVSASIPSSDPAKTLSPGEDYGVGTLATTDAMLGGLLSHVHVTGRFINVTDDYFYPALGNLVDNALTGRGVSGGYVPPPNVGLSTLSGAWNNTGGPGKSTNAAIDPVKLNVVHPVRGQYYIVRTVRTHYRASSSPSSTFGTPAFIVYAHLGGASPNGVVVGYQGQLLLDEDSANRYLFDGTNGTNQGWI